MNYSLQVPRRRGPYTRIGEFVLKQEESSARSVNPERIVLGCVADNRPLYLDQAWRLLHSLRRFGGSSADCDFILCVVEAVDPSYVHRFRALGAKVRVVPRHSAAVPVTNKLGFWQLPEITDYERVLCLDCDTIVVRDPMPPLQGRCLHARIVGLPTVPHRVFMELFQVFRLKMPDQEYRCALSGEPTIVYFNTGVLAMDRQTVTNLVPRWVKLTDALIKLELMNDRKWFTEQAALTLALVESGCPFQLLGNEMNFPFPGGKHPLVEDIDPRIIHYHHQVERSGRIKLSGYPLVDARIKAFNRALPGALVKAPADAVRRTLGRGLRKLAGSFNLQ